MSNKCARKCQGKKSSQGTASATAYDGYTQSVTTCDGYTHDYALHFML